MKYKIKVGNKYLVGESVNETLSGTVRGDTTAVYSRFVGEMSAYDFCDNIEAAEAFDRVTACDYVRGMMERQNYGFYPGEIKLIDADAEETVAHCKKEENATFIAMILDADAEGKVYVPDRKVGEWIKMSDRDGVYLACSECGEDLSRILHYNPQFDLFPRLESIDKTNYCPNCGAKMVGE